MNEYINRLTKMSLKTSSVEWISFLSRPQRVNSSFCWHPIWPITQLTQRSCELVHTQVHVYLVTTATLSTELILTHGGRDKMINIFNTIFKCIFLNDNFWISNKISLKGCMLGSNWQFPNIGLDNGLAPNRWQAIIWSNDDPGHRHVYVSHGH